MPVWVDQLSKVCFCSAGKCRLFLWKMCVFLKISDMRTLARICIKTLLKLRQPFLPISHVWTCTIYCFFLLSGKFHLKLQFFFLISVGNVESFLWCLWPKKYNHIDVHPTQSELFFHFSKYKTYLTESKKEFLFFAHLHLLKWGPSKNSIRRQKGTVQRDHFFMVLGQILPCEIRDRVQKSGSSRVPGWQQSSLMRRSLCGA